MMPLDHIPVQYIKGVGPARQKMFANLGVATVSDLFYLFPRRYEDRRTFTAVKDVRPGEYQTLSVRVLDQGARRSWYTRKHVYEALAGDATGRVMCVWFNQPYMAQYFRPGRRVVLYGRVEIYKGRLQMVSPEYEILEGREDEQLSMGRIVPIYPLTRGLTQRYLRKVMAAALAAYKDKLDDVLPVFLRNKHRLFNLRHSMQALHFPDEMRDQQEGWRRIAFEEFFLFQVSVRKRRLEIVGRPGCRHRIDPGMIDQFCGMFPFALTRAQQRVIHEIAGDLQKDFPMLRLLQGDVGCGKTLVSLFGCVAAAVNGFQAAMLVPTEILARQHYDTVAGMLEAGPFKNLRLACLTGSVPKRRKEAIQSDLADGKIDIVIGTHALLTSPMGFRNLGMVVIDEQHKFGVRQRALLPAKGNNPHVLVMTATPIPRTLSLTLFGDLDVSVIDEMPGNRGTVVTRVIEQERAGEVYAMVRAALSQGQQAFVVCPVVQESELLDLKAAEVVYKTFRETVFRDFRVGMVHGQMKRATLNAEMKRFKAHTLDLLVATTVLEVGVDVPNASVMVIEHAERFGLSQLHQLRGRIGRGAQDAQCFLLADSMTEEAVQRLQAMAATTDGFVLAEKDLEIRGPGHYFGRYQHGLNELRFVNPLRQVDILELARAEADDLIHRDPGFKDPAHQALIHTIQKRYPGYLEHIEAG